MTNARVIGNMVLVRLMDGETMTDGGLVIPDRAREKPQRGRVVAVGPKASSVEIGDDVLFGKYAGSEMTIDGAEHVSMREDEILGVVERA